MSILVIGESLIDIVSTPGNRDRYSPGGAPANVALGLGRLGDEVEFLTDVGDDFHGGFLLAHLRESRVDVLARPTGATSTALAKLAADGSAEYDFRLRWEPDESLLEARTRTGVHFGSIAAFLQPGAAVIDRLLERIAPQDEPRSRGPLISFDPNIRPSIIGSHDQALPRFERLAARTDVLKLSDDDADWLYPGLDSEAQIDRILGLGASLVVLTCGSEGSLLATISARCEVSAEQVEVVDTIGAGDTFMTSLIHDLHTSSVEPGELGIAQLHHLGERAGRLAAITVGRQGADLPWAQEVSF